MEPNDIERINLTCAFIDATEELPSSKSIQDFSLAIETVAKTNEDLIDKINKLTGDIDHVTYVIKVDDQQYRIVDERIETLDVQILISKWRKQTILTELEDVFNEKLNYDCRDYQDLVRLNRDMLQLANKYKLFGNGAYVLENLEQLEVNFLRIQSSLQELFKLSEKNDQSDRTEIQDHLDNINNELNHLRNRFTNLDLC